MLRDWLILIDVKFNSPLMKKYQVLVFIFFLIFSNQRPLCNMVCLNQDPVNFKAFTDNSQCCSSLSVVLHVYAKDECHSWCLWEGDNSNCWRQLEHYFLHAHTYCSVYKKWYLCNLQNKLLYKNYKVLPYPHIIWTHILSQPVSFQHHILVYMQHRYVKKSKREHLPTL